MVTTSFFVPLLVHYKYSAYGFTLLSSLSCQHKKADRLSFKLFCFTIGSGNTLVRALSEFLKKFFLQHFPLVFSDYGNNNDIFYPSPQALWCYEYCTDRSLGLYLDLDFPDTRIYISISQESQSAWPQIWVQAQAYFYLLVQSENCVTFPNAEL